MILNIISKISTLLVTLVVVLSAHTSVVFAQTCGDTGTCKAVCDADEFPFNLGAGDVCGAGTFCCFPKPRASSCTSICRIEHGCTCPANCVNPTSTQGNTCGGVRPAAGAPDDSTAVFGTIRQPAGTERFGGAGQIGILAFISLLIRIFTIIAGLIVLFNFIISGYTYLTSEGNPKAHETVKNRITYSVIGIVIIVSAYTITALLSLIFFGSATFILNPTIAPPTP